MSDWPETNHSLIRRVKDLRDQHAWSELMALYRPVVHRLARRNGLDHENAEDVVQNVFVSVSTHIQNWEEKPDGPRFRNWLGRVARNAALNALTRAHPIERRGHRVHCYASIALPFSRMLQAPCAAKSNWKRFGMRPA